MDYSSLIAMIPSLIQAGTGAAQTIKGQKMGAGLEDPNYAIPKSAQDALAMYRTQAGRLQPAGYDAFINELRNIQAGAQSSINRGATSANQALGATLNASGQQIDALNKYQGFAAGDYQRRQQALAEALGTMAGYEDKKWQTDVMAPFTRKANAASSLVGAGMQNTYAGLSDTAGVFAAKQAAKEERAYQEKRDEQKWARYKDLFNTTAMLPSIGSETSTSTMTPDAQKAMDAYLNSAFDQYGDAYSSGTTPADYTPKSNQSEFYTPY